MFWTQNKEAKPEVSDEELAKKTQETTERFQHKTDKLEKEQDEVSKKLKDKYREQMNASAFNKKMMKGQLDAMMKKKKMLETQLMQFQKSNTAVQGIQHQMEYIKDTLEMADTMKDIVNLQQDKLKTMDMDKIQEMQDKLEELKVDAEEINEVMGRAQECEDVDEDEQDDMMEELSNEMMMEDKFGTKTNSNKVESKPEVVKPQAVQESAEDLV